MYELYDLLLLEMNDQGVIQGGYPPLPLKFAFRH